MTASVYRRALGDDLDLLPVGLRVALDDGDRTGRGRGTFDRAGTRRVALRPVLAVLARVGVLFPEYGERVPFEIVNTPTVDGGVHARRTFFFPGRTRVLTDTFRLVDGRMHDFMGPADGFEVEFRHRIVDGSLHMRSARQWLRVGPVRVRVPAAATISVVESWRDSARHIDIALTSPLLGRWFSYSGAFHYAFE